MNSRLLGTIFFRTCIVAALGFAFSTATIPAAYAQKRRAPAAPKNDSWVAAQQAFARLDYQTAYRLSQDVASRNPRNFEARRMAAKSARELEKYGECLNLASGLPPASVTNDDVGLVGECAWSSQFPAWVLTFLQQNMAVVEHRDMAQYWLGKYHYRRSEYTKADGYLTPIAALPARLEKDRQFMLSRIHELGIQGSSSTQPTNPNTQPAIAPTPSQPLNPANLPVRRDVPFYQRLASSTEGWFLTPDLRVRSYFSASQGKNVPIDPEHQVDYEQKLKTTPPDEEGAEKVLEKSDNPSLNRFGALLNLGVMAGYRTAALETNQYFQAAIVANAGVNGANWNDGYFTFADELPYAQQPLWVANKGYGVRGGVALDASLNKNFSASAKATIARVYPAFKSQAVAFVQDYGGEAKFQSKYVNVRAGGDYKRLASKHGRTMLTVIDGYADIEATTPFYVGFRNFERYPLFRYSMQSSINSFTDEILFFSQMGGSFLEFNITPRAQLNTASSIFFWLRLVNESDLTYYSPSKATSASDLELKFGSEELLRPSAKYNATRTEMSAGYEWQQQNRINVISGLTLSTRKATFRSGDEDLAADEQDRFKKLLTRTLEDYMTFFLECSLKLN